MATYSASVVDKATDFCSRDDQEMGEPLNVTINPDVDFRPSTSAA